MKTGPQSPLPDSFDDWPSPVLLVTESGTILSSNPATADLLGYTQTELLGNSLGTLVPANPADRTRLYRAIHRGDSPVSVDFHGSQIRCITRSGATFWAIASACLVSDALPDAMWVMIEPLEPGPHTVPLPNPEFESDSARLNSHVGYTLGSILDAFSSMRSRFPIVAESLSSELGADLVGIVSVNEDSQDAQLLFREITNRRIHHPRSIGETYPVAGTLAESAISSARPVIFSVSSSDEYRALYPGAGPIQEGWPYLSSVAVPVLLGQRVTGIIYAHSTNQVVFGQDHTSLLDRALGELFTLK